MFSDNEIKEIHDNIAKYSIKDSSFEEASSLTGEEKLTIVQDNTSKSFKVSSLVSYLNTHESIYHKVKINVVDSDTNKAVSLVNDELAANAALTYESTFADISIFLLVTSSG